MSRFWTLKTRPRRKNSAKSKKRRKSRRWLRLRKSKIRLLKMTRRNLKQIKSKKKQRRQKRRQRTKKSLNNQKKRLLQLIKVELTSSMTLMLLSEMMTWNMELRQNQLLPPLIRRRLKKRQRCQLTHLSLQLRKIWQKKLVMSLRRNQKTNQRGNQSNLKTQTKTISSMTLIMLLVMMSQSTARNNHQKKTQPKSKSLRQKQLPMLRLKSQRRSNKFYLKHQQRQYRNQLKNKSKRTKKKPQSWVLLSKSKRTHKLSLWEDLPCLGLSLMEHHLSHTVQRSYKHARQTLLFKSLLLRLLVKNSNPTQTRQNLKLARLRKRKWYLNQIWKKMRRLSLKRLRPRRKRILSRRKSNPNKILWLSKTK